MRRSPADPDGVEVTRSTFRGTSLEEDVAAVRGNDRPSVDLGAAGQLPLAGAVGADRVEVPAADEGDRPTVGGEGRLGVGGVFGDLVQVAGLDREQPAFGFPADRRRFG